MPQLTDAGIALYYNADLLAADGVSPAELGDARWDPDPAIDTLRPLLTRLTHGRQWGYNAANDLQGIYLNYIGSAGGAFTTGDRFAFDNPGAVTAFDYVVGLINTDRVSPPASDTNDNGDFSRNQFLAGRMAVFQSGTYNLAQIAQQATFRWGSRCCHRARRAGERHQRHCGCGQSGLPQPGGGPRGAGLAGQRPRQRVRGPPRRGDPRRAAAQRAYFDYWSAKRVDVTPFFAVLRGGRASRRPGGAGSPPGYQAIKPYFDEMFLGRRPVAPTLAAAQGAANTAARR